MSTRDTRDDNARGRLRAQDSLRHQPDERTMPVLGIDNINPSTPPTIPYQGHQRPTCSHHTLTVAWALLFFATKAHTPRRREDFSAKNSNRNTGAENTVSPDRIGRGSR